MAVLDGARVTCDIQRAVDVVVVGTGAGGAVAAATLAKAGAPSRWSHGCTGTAD